MGVQVPRDKPQDSLSVRERDNASARQRFSILRRGQVTMGRRVTDRPSRARASLPQLERHPGAYPGHHRRHGLPCWGRRADPGGEVRLASAFPATEREDLLRGQAEHDE